MSDVIEIDAEITESVGGGGGVAGYSYLPDKPQINGVTLVGNKSGNDLGLVNKETGKGLSEANYTQAEKTKLAGIPSDAEANVQADWNQTLSSADSFIKNKPTIIKDILVDGVSIVDASYEADIPIANVQRTGLIPATWMDKLFHIEAGAEVNVQSDWNQTLTNADDYIKNKPNLAAVATSGSYSDLSNKPKISDIQNDAGYVSHLSQLGCAYLEAEDDYAGTSLNEGKSFTAQMPSTRQSQYYLESGCMIAVKFPTDVVRAQTSPSVYSAPVIRICTMREPPNYYTSYYPIYFRGEMIPSNQIKADDVALLVYDSDNSCFEHIGYTTVSQFSSTKAGIVPACGVPYSDEMKFLTTSGWQTVVTYGYTSLNDFVQNLLINPTLKTINNESLIGSGNITISGGAITDVEVSVNEPPLQHLIITTDGGDTYHLPLMGGSGSDWYVKRWLMPAATTSAQGAMSATDKAKVDNLTSITTSEIDTIMAS